MVAAEQQRRQGERHIGVPESRETRPRHAAKLQHREMKPTLVQYEAPGWGVGEVWLDDEGRVFHSELPVQSDTAGSDAGHVLAGRLKAFFAGELDDFRDVRAADRRRVLRRLRQGAAAVSAARS